MSLTSRSLVSKLVPHFILVKSIHFEVKLKTKVLSLCEIAILDWKPKWNFIPNKKGSDLETKLHEVRHMSMLEFFTLAYQNPFQHQHCQTCVASKLKANFHVLAPLPIGFISWNFMRNEKNSQKDTSKFFRHTCFEISWISMYPPYLAFWTQTFFESRIVVYIH